MMSFPKRIQDLKERVKEHGGVNTPVESMQLAMDILECMWDIFLAEKCDCCGEGVSADCPKHGWLL
jgi:hypothetical protein